MSIKLEAIELAVRPVYRQLFRYEHEQGWDAYWREKGC